MPVIISSLPESRQSTKRVHWLSGWQDGPDAPTGATRGRKKMRRLEIAEELAMAVNPAWEPKDMQEFWALKGLVASQVTPSVKIRYNLPLMCMMQMERVPVKRLRVPQTTMEVIHPTLTPTGGYRSVDENDGGVEGSMEED